MELWKRIFPTEVLTVVLIPRSCSRPTLLAYQVWSYQADDASYTQIGFVTDWNKKEWADSIDGFSSFPDSADKDHDGIVYLLTNAKGKETANRCC